jgi:hypothetical protein
MRRNVEEEAKADRRAETDGRDVTEQSDPVARVQRAVGNQALQREAESAGSRPGLRVEPPDSPAEREAERVSEAVMRDVERSDRTTAGNEDSAGEPSRATGPVDVERSARANGRANTGGEGTNTGRDRTSEDADDLAERIERWTGSGRSLPASERSVFEPRFGRDFGDVTVHDDAAADDLARSLNADAFTTGSDIFFRRGTYRAGTTEGRSLLAHELTHVVQQDSAAGGRPARRVQRQQGGMSTMSGQSRVASGQQNASGGATGQNQSAGGMSHKSGQSRLVQQLQTPATVTDQDWKTPLDMGWLQVFDRQKAANMPAGETGVMEGGRTFTKGTGDEHRVAPDDVHQFKSGDCYLMATLMAVADTNPSLIKSMIDRQDDGTYEVTFYERDGVIAPPSVGEPATTVTVKPTYIMGSVPSKEEAKQTAGVPETWVQVIEKGYAIYEYGRQPENSEMARETRKGKDPTARSLAEFEELYSVLDEGADRSAMSGVQSTLTGSGWEQIDTDAGQHTAISKVNAAIEAGNPVVVSVWGERIINGDHPNKPADLSSGHVYWVENLTGYDGGSWSDYVGGDAEGTYHLVDPRHSRKNVELPANLLPYWNLSFYIG